MNQIGSYWKLVRITQVFFILTKVSHINRLSGSSFIETPESLKRKKAIVNIKNNDRDDCFILSVLSLLKRDEIGDHPNRASNYEKFRNVLKYKNIPLPMKLKDIPVFERLNPGLAINVLSYNEINFVIKNTDDDENAGLKHPYIDIIHRTKVEDVEPFYLLLLEKGKRFHYTAVHHLQRLMNLANSSISGIRIQSVWCVHCLSGLRNT